MSSASAAEKEVEKLKRYTEELRATVSDLSRQLHRLRSEAKGSGADREAAAEADEADEAAVPRVVLLKQWPAVSTGASASADGGHGRARPRLEHASAHGA